MKRSNNWQQWLIFAGVLMGLSQAVILAFRLRDAGSEVGFWVTLVVVTTGVLAALAWGLTPHRNNARVTRLRVQHPDAAPQRVLHAAVRGKGIFGLCPVSSNATVAELAERIQGASTRLKLTKTC